MQRVGVEAHRRQQALGAADLILKPQTRRTLRCGRSRWLESIRQLGGRRRLGSGR